MQKEKTTEYKNLEYENLDKIIERTIKFNDSQGNVITLNADATRRQYAPTATDAEWEQLVDTMEANGLDPRRREVYFQKYETKDGPRVSIVTSYLVYSARAFRSGKIKSISAPRIVKEGVSMDSWYGEIDIERTDIEGKITWQTPMKEVNKHQSTWNLMPEFMLKKNTFAQGLRFYLPDVIGGLPYLQEELSSKMPEADIDISVQEENKIEPSEEERGALDKALEEEKIRAEEEAKKQDGVKAKALSGYQAKINTFDDFEKLNQWSKVLNIEKHPFKDGILSMIGIRRTELDPTILEHTKDLKTQDGPTRKDVIDDIVKTTGAKFADIKAYVTDEMLTGGLVSGMLSGEAGALQEFNEGLAEFLSGQNEPDLGYEAEMDIPE